MVLDYCILPVCPSLHAVGNADIRTAALGYFITPCVAMSAILACYTLLPHLVSGRHSRYIRTHHPWMSSLNS